VEEKQIPPLRCGMTTKNAAEGQPIQGRTMVESERQILREKTEEATLGERRPFDSSRQAEYEDSVAPSDDWQDEDS